MSFRTKSAGLAVLIFVSAANPGAVAEAQVPGASAQPAAPGQLPHYILGPNDEITIMSVHVEELAGKKLRITTSGDINLAMVGRIQAAGLTLEQLEGLINERLKNYFKEPDVAVNVSEFRSQPVSVFGSVNTPGVIQLEGRKTLVEVLSMAGGLKADAGSTIKITRRSQWGAIPLSTAKAEGDCSCSIGEVDIRSIENATRPQDNIQILPNDVITVTRADIVYVIGEVNRPGGFALQDRKGISIIEALARAEGAGTTAAIKSAKIIRPVPGANRVEISVNLQDVLRGKATDIMLQPDDILYVPDSYAKGTLRRTLETALQVATGMAIYR